MKFVFDHPVAKGSGDKWYWDLNRRFVVKNPERLLEHFTKLCLHFPEIAAHYTLQQIDQGIWFLLSEPIRCGAYFANPAIPSKLKDACIRSMFNVYSRFVGKSKIEVMENCFDMWWDLICKAYWSELKYGRATTAGKVDSESLTAENKFVLDAMLETLTKILQLQDDRCIGYALHGLGHLHHPDVKAVVQNFINQNRDRIPKEGLLWVEACRDGTVM